MIQDYDLPTAVSDIVKKRVCVEQSTAFTSGIFYIKTFQSMHFIISPVQEYTKVLKWWGAHDERQTVL